jgi:hypothetical protein
LSATRSGELRPGAEGLLIELRHEFSDPLILDLNLQARLSDFQ